MRRAASASRRFCFALTSNKFLTFRGILAKSYFMQTKVYSAIKAFDGSYLELTNIIAAALTAKFTKPDAKCFVQEIAKAVDRMADPKPAPAAPEGRFVTEEEFEAVASQAGRS